jgi:hypothetical protein
MQTHQEMVEVAIRILENVRMGHIKSAKERIENLTPVETIKLFSMGQSGYESELEKLKELAIYW